MYLGKTHAILIDSRKIQFYSISNVYIVSIAYNFI